MQCILICLFYITFVIGIKGAWLKPSVLVDNDATELTELAEKFWSLKPEVFQHKGPLVLCRFIDRCCANENRLQAISLMVTSIVSEYHLKKPYTTVINTCINSTVSEDKSQSCSSIQQLISPSILRKDRFITIEYLRIIMSYFTELNDMLNNIYESCNSEEIHALLCLSDTTLVKTCVSKILQNAYDSNGYPAYQELLTQTKQTLIVLNQELFELSVRDASTN